MPSVSAKQARTMAAAAHDPKFAKKMGIPQNVAHDFNQADKGTDIRKKPIRRSLIGGGKKKSMAERMYPPKT